MAYHTPLFSFLNVEEQQNNVVDGKDLKETAPSYWRGESSSQFKKREFIPLKRSFSSDF